MSYVGLRGGIADWRHVTTASPRMEQNAERRMDTWIAREGVVEPFHMPPGQDAWIVGDEKCVLLDFGGLKGYATGS
jgi:hypothetical protein